MKKILFGLLLLAIATTGVFAQESDAPSSLFSFNIFGPLVGLYQASFETGISDNFSIQIAPAYLNAGLSPILGPALEEENAEFWSIGGTVGAYYYFGDTVLKDFFIGPRIGASYFSITADSTVDVTGLLTTFSGIAGYRWIFGNFAVALGGVVGFSGASVEAELNTFQAATVGTGIGYGVLLALDIALY